MSNPTAPRPTAATPPTPAIPALDLPEATVSAPVHLTIKMQQSTIDFNIIQDAVEQNMNDLHTFGFDGKPSDMIGDYSSFLNGSTLVQNPFAVDDELLDSPLGLESGLSTVSSSPFDFVAGSFGSPEFDLPSLFSGSTGVQQDAWNVATPELVASPQTSTPELLVSPQMLTLDTAAAAPEDVKPVKPHPKRSVTKSKAKPSPGGSVKDRFTGTRNTAKPPIDFNAPTLPKQYVIPACTSRKLAPQAITSKLSGVKRSRSIEENEDSEDLPPELLEAIVEKRRTNTLAARRSRERKANHLRELEDKIVDLTNERDTWRERCQELERLVKVLRGGQ